MPVANCYLSCLLLAVLFAPRCHAETDVLATLRAEHPRLLATREHFDRLRSARKADTRIDQLLGDIEKSAEEYLDAPLLERKKLGKRLLPVSREALRRITMLAMTYQMTGDARFAERAEKEMLNVCEFTNWNPSHFLDVAHMAAAVGLGYDWLYDTLPESSRERIRQGLRDKAIKHIARPHGWKRAKNNWNPVCYAGLTIGALAIAEHEPALASRVVTAAAKNNPLALSKYDPEGVYPEGPSYWDLGTTFQAMLIDSLRSALGSDFGLCTPAFKSSGQFIVHTTGPTGKTFNFSDSFETINTPAALFWIAGESGRPDWVHSVERLTSGKIDSRVPVLLPLWIAAHDSRDTSGSLQQVPLSWYGKGEQPVVLFRDSWSDPNAMYLATKGGRARLSHAHMDAGSFVMEADGVRWAIDPEKTAYYIYEKQGIQIWDQRQTGQRWKVLLYSNVAHSTILIDRRPFDINGNATVTHYTPLTDGKGIGKAGVDLSEVFSNAEQATREFMFDADDRQIVITDRLQGLEPGIEICWTMVTEAKSTIADRMVTLAQDGKQLALEVESSTPGRWQANPFAPPEGFLGEPREGVSLLTWTTHASSTGENQIVVRLKPSGSKVE